MHSHKEHSDALRSESALMPEREIPFPSQTIVTASAGSGKTYTLSWRFVQFLLSDAIPRNKLWNLLAITFTKNAAAEMKQRIILHLKNIALGDPAAIKQAQVLVDGNQEILSARAAEVMDTILSGYSDFQVQTIDSFLERIFRSSALDLQLPPDFQVELSSGRLFSEAFGTYAKSLKENSPELAALFGILESYETYRSSSSRFLWKPATHLRDRAQELHDYIVTLDKPVALYEAGKDIAELNREFLDELRVLRERAIATGFDLTANFEKLIAKVEGGAGIAGTLGSKSLFAPLKKGKRSEDEKISAMSVLQPQLDLLASMQTKYIEAEARGSYTPALKAIHSTRHILDDIKWRESRVLIQDVSVILNSYLRNARVPEVYFRLGEQITHFFLDEFQDTSPIQWAVLFPLIENALASSGSLFVVGDPKQSINLFRGADWQIMQDLETQNIIPSAQHILATLDTNYRSGEAIVSYSRDLFCTRSDGDDRDAAKMSGLDNFQQSARADMQDRGYVEVISIPAVKEEDGDDDEAERNLRVPEEERIIEIIENCRERGYTYRDIGILASKNSEIVQTGQWLNRKGIPFVSYSSLDVRQRKISGEVFSILAFLDSPVDDFSFATAVLGDVFQRWIAGISGTPAPDDIRAFLLSHAQKRGATMPLYKAFQETYPDVYERSFAQLLNIVGYLPVYDLLTAVFSVFRCFELFPEEEGAMAKLLETAIDSAGDGGTGLKGFLALTEDETGDATIWSMNVPETLDAVQLMTIHKAKGLEFPVGIVLLYDSDAPRPDYFIEDAGNAYRLLRLKKDTAAMVADFEELYRSQNLKQRADSLNRLYVALTRPRLELYVVNIYKERTNTMPSPLLQRGDQQRGAKEERYVSETKSPIAAQRVHTPVVSVKPVGGFRRLQNEDALRGTWIHAILSEIEYYSDDLPRQFAEIVSHIELQLPEGETPKSLIRTVQGYFGSSAFRQLFEEQPARIVYRELDIAGADGYLNRLDRVLVDPDRVTVVDFKTGQTHNEDSYRRQIRRYMDALAGLYPDRAITGMLVYTDAGKIEEVGR